MTRKSTAPDTAAQAASSTGMPAKKPREQRSRTEEPDSPQDASVEASLELPHERDQSVEMTDGKPDPVIKQAEQDVRRGVKDTSKSVEMDRAYRKLSKP